MQFVHEEDMAEALALAVEKRNVTGIFNLAGQGVIPLSEAIREAGAVSIPVFHPLVYGSTKVLWPLGLSVLPSPEIDYLRYPCLVGTRRAEKILGFKPRYSLLETIRSVRR